MDEAKANQLHKKLTQELSKHCALGESRQWARQLGTPAQLSTRCNSIQATLRLQYPNGWAPPYTFDEAFGAVLPAAAAAVNLQKLAIVVRDGEEMDPPIAAALAVLGSELAASRQLEAVSVQIRARVSTQDYVSSKRVGFPSSLRGMSCPSWELPPILQRAVVRFVAAAGTALAPGCNIRVVRHAPARWGMPPLRQRISICFLEAASAVLRPRCATRLLRFTLPGLPAELHVAFQRLAVQLAAGVAAQRLQVLMGLHRRAWQAGCLLPSLPMPLLMHIMQQAHEPSPCRIEVHMQDPISWAPIYVLFAPGPPQAAELAPPGDAKARLAWSEGAAS